MITVVIIGSSLLAIFGKMPWPALFSLGMFVAVFFGGPQITKAITGREVCCLVKGQILENGKCVAASGYKYVGKRCCNNWGCCPKGFVITNAGTCQKPGLDSLKYWIRKKLKWCFYG